MSSLDAAADRIRPLVEPAILNHSIRTARYAMHLATAEGVAGDELDALAVAGVLHDTGAVRMTTSDVRFEVAGADTAVTLAREVGVPETYLREVWLGVALHTSSQIAEAAGVLPRFVRLAVEADFGADLVPDALRRDVEGEYPRLDVERVLSAVIVDQAADVPSRAPRRSWAAAMLEAHRSRPDDPDARLAAF